MKKLLILLALLSFGISWGQKAITVTDSLKNYNRNYFKNQSIGQIKKVNKIPQTFTGRALNWSRTDGYNTLNDSIHKADGFHDVVTPAFDQATQKLGDLFFDIANEIFTYPIEDLTQEEIDALSESTDDLDAGIAFEYYTEEGDRLFKRTYKRIYRRVNKDNGLPNSLTKGQGRKLARWFQPVYEYLRNGNWFEANKIIDQIIIDRAQDMIDVQGIGTTINWLKDEIQNFVDNEYDL